MISINGLVDLAASIEGKNLIKSHVPGPTGVRGRNSNNSLIREKLNWDYSLPLYEGIKRTYNWICERIDREL
jgi:nucleoside-diphosphate-sugar epimerase